MSFVLYIQTITRDIAIDSWTNCLSSLHYGPQINQVVNIESNLKKQIAFAELCLKNGKKPYISREFLTIFKHNTIHKKHILFI
jgi:hypothetical protein